MFCFNETTWKYFGCIPVRIALYMAILITVVTQFYMSIYYLSFHVWFAFIPFFATLGFHVLLGLSIRMNNWFMALAFVLYQVLFTLLLLAASIWMLVVLCSPSHNFVYSRCRQDPLHTTSHCKHNAETQGGTYFAVFLGFFAANLLCCHVFYRNFRSIKGNQRNTNTSGAQRVNNNPYPQPSSVPTVSETTARQQATPIFTTPQRFTETPVADPYRTSRDIQLNPYSPGNTYPSQPIQPMMPPAVAQPQQPAYNVTYSPEVPYPTVRGHVDTAYPAPSAPAGNHLYDAPPAYESDKW